MLCVYVGWDFYYVFLFDGPGRYDYVLSHSAFVSKAHRRKVCAEVFVAFFAVVAVAAGNGGCHYHAVAYFKAPNARPENVKAMIEAVKPLLLTEDASRVEIKLSDSEGKEETVTLTNAVEKIFVSLPDSAKIDLSEKTEADKAAGDISNKVDVADVEKYAEEKKLSFEDALIELQKAGKITTD